MAASRAERTPPEPDRTRTDRDWIMIALGAGLILLFLVGGYMSLSPSDAPNVPKNRGPVKDPKKLGFLAPYAGDLPGKRAGWTNLPTSSVDRSKPTT